MEPWLRDEVTGTTLPPTTISPAETRNALLHAWCSFIQSQIRRSILRNLVYLGTTIMRELKVRGNAGYVGVSSVSKRVWSCA